MGERSKSPNFLGVYIGLDTGEEPTLADATIMNASGAFAMGCVGASLYHFAKALRKERTLISGINAARTYGPRFGGTFTLVSLPVGLTGYAIHRFRGGFDDEGIACCAATGALLRAPRGLGSALRAAAVWASVPAAVTALDHLLENSNLYNPQRPYSYPHYRLQPQPEEDN